MKTLGRILAVIVLVLVALAAVGYLVLKRPDIPYATLEAKYADGASRYMDLPGGLHVHYRDQGNAKGPTLVMVHGFSASLADWEPWVKILGGDYRIISLDLPGHGLTRAPAGYIPTIDSFAEVADAVPTKLGVSRYVVIGNSMGGLTAWNVALRHPEHLDGLVLVDAAGWGHEAQGDKAPVILRLLQTPVGSALRDLDNRALIAQGLKAAFIDPKLVDKALVDRYSELSRAPGHRDILIHAAAGGRPTATPQTLAAIKVPTLIMFGEDDRLIPAADGKRFADAIPGSTLKLYPGVGHVPMEQIPEQSAADLKAWLDAKVYPKVQDKPAA